MKKSEVNRSRYDPIIGRMSSVRIRFTIHTRLVMKSVVLIDGIDETQYHSKTYNDIEHGEDLTS